MTHITKASDVGLVARRARRSLELLETRGELTWKRTHEWSGPLKAAGGTRGGAGTVSRPTERAALEPDPLAQLHDRYRAALALAVDAFAELEAIITTATASGQQQREHKRAAERDADTCTSCARIGHVSPRRGARWCRWCEDTVRALAAEWTWEPNTAPPLERLVRRHAEGRRITVGDVGSTMRRAGVKRRQVAR